MRMKLSDNMSFRLVALGVAIILWTSIHGRRTSTMTKVVETSPLTSPTLEIVRPIPPVVKVEIAGPRVILEKVATQNFTYTVDLTAMRAGQHVVQLNGNGLRDLPTGARVIGIEPRELAIELRVSTPKPSED